MAYFGIQCRLHVCSTWEPSELSESEIASKIDGKRSVLAQYSFL